MKTDNEIHPSNNTEATQAFDALLTELKKVINAILLQQNNNPLIGQFNLLGLAITYQRVVCQMLLNVLQQSENSWQQLEAFAKDQKRIFSNNNKEGREAVFSPRKKDRRFKHKAWREKSYYNILMQTYLNFSEKTKRTLLPMLEFDRRGEQQAEFVVDFILDALSPNNWPWSNPEIIEVCKTYQGENLIKGLTLFLSDLTLWQGYVNTEKTDLSAFTLGENIATSPGKVIFRNDVIELIQYEPRTEKVHETPVLFVTSWINKYYLLDLKEKNSIIKWTVEQGYTVFVISWVNPDRSSASNNFGDYVEKGILAAIHAICRSLQVKQTHILGYCLGGTIVGTAVAYLAAQKESHIKSMTIVASMLDFTNPGALGNFTGEDQIHYFEARSRHIGYWDGYRMAAAFNFISANENIWPYIINYYYKGKDPIVLDALYWAIDLTNTPVALYSFFMRGFYLNNLLLTPNRVRILQEGIDLGKIDCPTYYAGFSDDHISPWESCYASTRLLPKNTRFVLANGTHFTGMTNLQYPKKSYYYHHEDLSLDSPSWLKAAIKEKGTWWDDWVKWLNPLSGKQVIARSASEGKLPPITDAPGEFVKVRVNY